MLCIAWIANLLISDLPHYSLEIRVVFEWQRKSESSFCSFQKWRRPNVTTSRLHHSFTISFAKLIMKCGYKSQQQQHSVGKCIKNVTFIYFFLILAFSTYLCPVKIDLSGNTVWPQASGFQKLVKMDNFGIFNLLLSIQNVIIARFARNVEWDFFCDFQTTCTTNIKW